MSVYRCLFLPSFIILMKVFYISITWIPNAIVNSFDSNTMSPIWTWQLRSCPSVILQRNTVKSMDTGIRPIIRSFSQFQVSLYLSRPPIVLLFNSVCGLFSRGCDKVRLMFMLIRLFLLTHAIIRGLIQK